MRQKQTHKSVCLHKFLNQGLPTSFEEDMLKFTNGAWRVILDATSHLPTLLYTHRPIHKKTKPVFLLLRQVISNRCAKWFGKLWAQVNDMKMMIKLFISSNKIRFWSKTPYQWTLGFSFAARCYSGIFSLVTWDNDQSALMSSKIFQI